VFCVDLEHIIYVQGYSDPLVFDTGFVTETGGGGTITEPISNEIGQLANFGQAIYAAGGANYAETLTAVQGAIWSLEYGVDGQRATSSNATVDAEIVHLLGSVSDNGKGYANGLLADPHAEQNMVTGLVPEPASWALMIGGFGMAGAMLRRRRSAAATA
jgi:PEP-CTERM motif